MCPVHARKEQKAAAKPSFKLLLWTAIAGLIFGLIQAGEPVEDGLRTLRNNINWREASGEIVLVKIDDKSVRDVGAWPWPRSRYADLTDRLTEAGARRIVFNIPLSGPTHPVDDRRFAQALDRSGRAILAVKTRSGPNNGAEQASLPYRPLTRRAQIGSTTAQYNFQSAVWRIPYAATTEGKSLWSIAALLANRRGPANDTFMVDYSVDPASIPALSATTVLSGDFGEGAFRGKDVVIGAATEGAADYYYIPGTGKMPSSYIHIIGAETLKAGNPVSLGWAPLFAVALALCALALSRKRATQRYALLGGALIAVVLGPAALERKLVYLDITPALFVLQKVNSVMFWRQ